MTGASYASDLNDAQWSLIEWHIPPARPGGRPRRVDIRAVVDAIFYLLRTGCQWRLLPKDFPPWGTVWWSFRRWRHRALYPVARARAGRGPGPSAVIMDGQSVKTTEKGVCAASMGTSG